MKKLITLFSILAFFSLIFIGCQSTENISGPDDLDKKGASVTSFNWETPVASAVVDLVAGQKNVVGKVEVAKVEPCGLKVTYTLDIPTSKIYEVHVDLTLDPAKFTVNKNGSPIFGNFDSKTYGATITGINGNQVVVEFNCEQLKKALGVESMDGVDKIYIAAHSVVDYCYAGAMICPDLTNAQGAKLLSGLGNFWTVDNPTHYMNNLRFDKVIVPDVTVFKGWCLDPERSGFDSEDIPHYTKRPLNFVCSTDDIPFGTCLIDYPENLKKVNWVINNRGDFSIQAIQYAIWSLLSTDPNEGSLDSFKDEANQLLATIPANLSKWKPGCGDKVLVLVYDTTKDPCSADLLQPIGIEVDVKCECTKETAMGFNFPLDNTSAPFNHQWFRYFAFSY